MKKNQTVVMYFVVEISIKPSNLKFIETHDISTGFHSESFFVTGRFLTTQTQFPYTITPVYRLYIS